MLMAITIHQFDATELFRSFLPQTPPALRDLQAQKRSGSSSKPHQSVHLRLPGPVTHRFHQPPRRH